MSLVRFSTTLFITILSCSIWYGSAIACSRILITTDHGESVVRTLDWDKKLGTIARVHPKNEKRKTRPVPEYNVPATWVSKYQSVSLEEHDVFHGTAAEAINDQGLSASVLYMDTSKPFIGEYKDTGAPAVNMADVVSYFAENFATVEEAKKAFEAGKFQIAWNSELPEAGKHGLHFSVQDKTGDIMLIQLNKGGKVIVHHGEEDLRVMANSPLQQDHRAYVAQFDLEDPDVSKKIPSSISSKDRNLRLIWTTKNQKGWKGLNWPQTEAKLQSTFDAGALVPQEILDPSTQAPYSTWIQYVYNLDTGSFKLRNLETYNDIRFSMSDIEDFTTPMCADLAAQASEGEGKAVWKKCKESGEK